MKLKSIGLGIWMGWTALLAQQPAPPPPPSEDGSEQNGGGKPMDLSNAPVPETGRSGEMRWSAEELKATPVMISLMSVGYVPPPIIKLDASGMPREVARDPLEYPPAVFHLGMDQGTVKMASAQNQVGPATAVPRKAALPFSYEIPAGNSESLEGGKGPRLKALGMITVPPGATHLLVVLWKEPQAKRWNEPLFKVLDVSPGKVKANEMVVINASGRDLSVHRGDAPYQIRPGFMGEIALPVNERGQMPVVASAKGGQKWEPLAKTIVSPLKGERMFFIAWPVPVTRAQPAGVAMQMTARLLKDPKPLTQAP